jgi:CO/xanthine dehydrogenase FAD-binding subunit
MTTALSTDEVLVALEIERPEPSVRFRYRKIRHPASGYAVVGVAAALGLQDDLVLTATIGVIGATARAFAADAATTFLIGKSLSSALSNRLPRLLQSIPIYCDRKILSPGDCTRPRVTGNETSQTSPVSSGH